MMDENRTHDGTCPDEMGQPSNADTREELKRDAGELVSNYASTGKMCDPLYIGILSLLDRQAAITEREWREKCEGDECCDFQELVDICEEQRRRIDELQEQADEHRKRKAKAGRLLNALVNRLRERGMFTRRDCRRNFFTKNDR